MRSEPVDVFLAVEGFVVERCGTAVAAQQGELAVVPDDADFGPRREDIDRAARCGIFEACRRKRPSSSVAGPSCVRSVGRQSPCQKSCVVIVKGAAVAPRARCVTANCPSSSRSNKTASAGSSSSPAGSSMTMRSVSTRLCQMRCPKP